MPMLEPMQAGSTFYGFRGLLCARCNYVVGAIESNGEIIPLAKKYLKVWKEI